MIRNLYPDVPDPAETQKNCYPLKQPKTQVNKFQTEPDPEHSHKNIQHPHTQELWQHNLSAM